MKRFLAFTLCVVVIIATARVLAPNVYTPPEQETMAKKVLKVVALWWIGRKLRRQEAPPKAEQQVPEPFQMAEELAIQNQSPMRAASSEREEVPLLDHGSGW